MQSFIQFAINIAICQHSIRCIYTSYEKFEKFEICLTMYIYIVRVENRSTSDVHIVAIRVEFDSYIGSFDARLAALQNECKLNSSACDRVEQHPF